jgi:hypothetical protein
MSSKSIADVAAASRPGSLEARHIHGCTCIVEGHLVLSSCCPAHGPANGSRITTYDSEGRAIVDVVDRYWLRPEPPLPRRSLWRVLLDALRGAR